MIGFGDHTYADHVAEHKTPTIPDASVAKSEAADKTTNTPLNNEAHI
jgi:hypothetical protein